MQNGKAKQASELFQQETIYQSVAFVWGLIFYFQYPLPKSPAKKSKIFNSLFLKKKITSIYLLISNFTSLPLTVFSTYLIFLQ